ncbi:C40 family peptidase [Streptomyces sp. NPDC051207]|uniref:C40 family peptidase n=1 Tax=Streptomyces sp. NPDC051207 TaxID=3154641 RepID=UPI00341DDA4E
MSGRLLRLVCAAAVATQAVLVAVPAAAEPEPGESGGPSVAEPEPAEPGGPSVAEPDRAEPGERTVAELLTDLQRLYREAEQATETYNATEERLRKQRAETDRLNRALAAARLRLHDSRRAAGRLARQQYQSSTDISPYVRLLLARDPQRALDQGHVIGQLARGRAETVERLTGSEKKADDLARKARRALDGQLVLAERHKKARDGVRRRLKDVEEMLASLTAEQLADVARLEQDGIAKEQRRLVTSGALSTSTGRPTAAGERAVRFAVRQIGKPYQWGAEGPGAYDCSGLTSEAWAHAGKPLPRTSQEQWARLERVPLRKLRPGDLVVYFPEATHVALYLGDGMVVQAPRPGAKVKVSPIAANPVLGAVRPDPGGEPVARYTPPELPEGSTEGSDEGYAPAAPETSIR